MILNQLFNEGTNWHTDPEQQSMDATRRARLGREREPEGSDAIDAKLAANNNARQEYAETGRFWLKRKDSQEHISDAFVGKVAATAAAQELLKQQPELRGNLVITAYGPGEQQPVSEGKVKELGQDLKDKALSDAEFKAKYGKTRAEVRAAMREKSVAEGYQFKGPFPFDVDHMHGGRGINLPKAETKKYFTDKKQWQRAVDDINSSKYDDNSDYIGVTGRSTVEINGREWARWSDAQQKGYIELSSMSEQGVAEDSSTTWEVSFDYGPHQSETVNVKAGSEEEARAKVETAAEKRGRSIMINWAKPAEQDVAEAGPRMIDQLGNEVQRTSGQVVQRSTEPRELRTGDSRSSATGVVTKTATGLRHTPYGDVTPKPKFAKELDEFSMDIDDGELGEGEKVGNMDADKFDAAMARLKQLAGAGPMKTVYDPAKRVYRNMPTAQQPGNKK
jgi:hypothetical protein